MLWIIIFSDRFLPTLTFIHGKDKIFVGDFQVWGWLFFLHLTTKTGHPPGGGIFFFRTKIKANQHNEIIYRFLSLYLFTYSLILGH